MILLTDHINNDDSTIPTTVRRNAYSGWLESFSDTDDVWNITGFPLEFIRAPYIENPDDSKVLTVCKDRVVGPYHPHRPLMIVHVDFMNREMGHIGRYASENSMEMSDVIR